MGESFRFREMGRGTEANSRSSPSDNCNEAFDGEEFSAVESFH